MLYTVWPDGVPGRADRRYAGQEFLAVLDKHDAVAHRQQVLLCLFKEGLQRPAGELLVGPKVEIRLLDVELRIREVALAVITDIRAEMVDVRVAHHHRVDVLRVNAGLLHTVEQLAGCRAEIFSGAHAGVEQHQMAAGVDDECILLQHRVFQRQEVAGELTRNLFLGETEEGLGRISERQRPVGYDGRFGSAELEAVEVGRLRAEYRRLGERRRAREPRRHEGGAALQQPAA